MSYSSGAEAQLSIAAFCGTTEVVPFQGMDSFVDFCRALSRH
jgi:hypothetical protein